MDHVYVNHLDPKVIEALDKHVMEQKNASYKEGFADGRDEGYSDGYLDGKKDYEEEE